MLDSHLIAKTSPKANEKNVIKFKNYRVTVLTDRLFRIEKDNKKLFEDGATQSVWFRDMPANDYTYEVVGNILTVKTPRVSLYVNGDKFSDSYAVLDDGRTAKLNNVGNLYGTFRTLDGRNGDRYMWVDKNHSKIVPKGEGVCSKTGVAVYDDKKSLILADDGMVKVRRPEQLDLYVFAYGYDYEAAVKAIYLICGNAPMVPRYSLGNWWSRYHKYTDKEYIHLLDDFQNSGVPLSVATIDMDWHYSDDVIKEKNIPEKYAHDIEYMGFKGITVEGDEWSKLAPGWTGYSWNKEFFPDYKAFLNEIKKRGLKITLNLHPASGVRYWEDQYEDFCKAMNVDPSTKKCVQFDFTDSNYINNYFKILHKPYEADGVEFWWIDWQQGVDSKIKGFDPLWALNHYHTYDIAKNHLHPLVMSRYCGLGSHRYPFGFSGDTFATWESLRYLPKFTNRATNVGYTWWSHDIGGHMDGTKDDERMARYIQYATFNPILRLHCTHYETTTKDPAVFCNGTKFIIQDFMRFRHRLVPYIYTANYQNSVEGRPLTRPVYYVSPNEKEAYNYDNNYMFGTELFVAPVTDKMKKGYATVKAYLPIGEWTDIFNGAKYIGGRTLTFMRRLDSIPVLAKAGAIIPMAKTVEGNSPVNPKALDVLIYKGNNDYAMYEDADNGDKLFTKFKLSDNGSELTLIISTEGTASVAPEKRSVTLDFKDLFAGETAVYKSGEKIEVPTDDNHNLTAVIEDFDYNAEYKVVVKYKAESETDYIRRRALYEIQHIEGVAVDGWELYKDICAAKNLKEAIKAIEESKISDVNKKAVIEAIGK